MQAHHAMPNFRCRSVCQHKECQRHNNLGIPDTHAQCGCLGEVNASSIFLENVIDLANTLAQIMIICGIHECKARSTVDVTTYAFLHYDQVCYCLDTEPKKRLRKEDLFHELGKRCLMNRVEAHLAYNIIKRGFKAFYYKRKETEKDECGNKIEEDKFADECLWVHAAKKTAESYARFDGLSCEEQLGYEAKIKVAYKKFYDRMKTRMSQPEGDDCNCCFCAKKRGHLVYAKVPCGKKKETKKHVCPICCKKKDKKKFVHPSRQMHKCPKCHKSHKCCSCEKYEFSLDWVKSIWDRPDFNLYYKQQIEDIERRLVHGSCFTKAAIIEEEPPMGIEEMEEGCYDENEPQLDALGPVPGIEDASNIPGEEEDDG